MQLRAQGVCCLAGSLPTAMSLLGELITTSCVPDLIRCRSLCGIPASITRKKDLVEALLLRAQCPHKHRAVIRHLTDHITVSALRSRISFLRRTGYVVPDSYLMSRGRAEIMDAIIRLDRPAGEYSSAQGQAAIASGQAASAGEYSLAQGQAASASKRQAHEEVQGQAANAAGQAASAGEYSSAQGAAGSHSADSSPGQSVGSHDVGMVMVAYDAGSSREASRRKLSKKWMKLARKACMRKHLPARVRHAVAEALLQEDPDAVVLKLREVVESKVGVDLRGKYGVLFDKALLRHTAKPVNHRRPRTRFVLAVGRRRAKRAPAS